jgi:hypothetical protein
MQFAILGSKCDAFGPVIGFRTLKFLFLSISFCFMYSTSTKTPTGRLTPDDLFSSDLTDGELETLFAHVNIPTLWVWSMKDEYGVFMPPHLPLVWLLFCRHLLNTKAARLQALVREEADCHGLYINNCGE